MLRLCSTTLPPSSDSPITTFHEHHIHSLRRSVGVRTRTWVFEGRTQKNSLHSSFALSLFPMAWVFILLSLACLVVWFNRDSKRPNPLPPGPPAEPLIGHLRLIPPDNQEMLFYKWGKIYGNIFLTLPST